MRTCCKCKIMKNLTEFTKDKQVRDGIRRKCKACDTQETYAWRKQNPAKHAKNQKAWRDTHLHVFALHAAKRRAAKLQRTPKWLTRDQLAEIRQFYKDAQYLTHYTKTRFQVDHIIPLCGKLVSGLHVPWNLQLLTEVENHKKYNRLKAG